MLLGPRQKPSCERSRSSKRTRQASDGIGRDQAMLGTHGLSVAAPLRRSGRSDRRGRPPQRDRSGRLAEGRRGGRCAPARPSRSGRPSALRRARLGLVQSGSRERSRRSPASVAPSGALDPGRVGSGLQIDACGARTRSDATATSRRFRKQIAGEPRYSRDRRRRRGGARRNDRSHDAAGRSQPVAHHASGDGVLAFEGGALGGRAGAVHPARRRLDDRRGDR